MADKTPRAIKVARTRTQNVARTSLEATEALRADVHVNPANLKRQVVALKRTWGKFEEATENYDGLESDQETEEVRTAAATEYGLLSVRYDAVVSGIEQEAETRATAATEMMRDEQIADLNQRVIDLYDEAKVETVRILAATQTPNVTADNVLE